MGKSASLQIRIPEGLNKRIEKAAKTADCEKNDFIRICLGEYIREKYERDDELLEKFRAIVMEAVEKRE